MITKWLILFSDPPDTETFRVGPFDTNNEALDFLGTLGCEITMDVDIHPWIGQLQWLGKGRKVIVKTRWEEKWPTEASDTIFLELKKQ